jgi:hypothetical protein
MSLLFGPMTTSALYTGSTALYQLRLDLAAFAPNTP